MLGKFKSLFHAFIIYSIMHIQSKHSKKNENKNMQTEVQLHFGFFSLVGKKGGNSI